jgi:hypothetical protein
MINVYNITSSAMTFFTVNVPVIGCPKGDERKRISSTLKIFTGTDGK